MKPFTLKWWLNIHALLYYKVIVNSPKGSSYDDVLKSIKKKKYTSMLIWVENRIDNKYGEGNV